MTREDFNPLPEDVVSLMDTLNGEYEKHRELKLGDVVLDLGANVGFFSQLALSKIGGTGLVVAIEPEPRNFALLRERVNANNAILINAAAVNHDRGEALLWSMENHPGGHSLYKASPHIRSQWVRTVRMSKLIQALSIFPNFIKIDVEGSELDILRDLEPYLEDYAPHIAMEIHSEELFQDCAVLFERNGFEFLPHPTHTAVCHARKL